VALDGEGQETEGRRAERGRPYFCPGCCEGVVFKRGTVVVPHFAHRPDSPCSWGVGESIRHHQMKYQVGDLFARLGIRFEQGVIPDRRADVVVGGRMVVECQESAISLEEWEARTSEYNRAGYPVLWVWDIGRVISWARGKTFGWLIAETAARERQWRELGLFGADEVRVPVEIRECQRRAFGLVYVLDAGGELRSCHMRRAAERESDGGPDGSWTGYRPKTLRIPGFQPTPLRPEAYSGPQGHRLVRMGEGAWWTGR
jgi:hypothetical protein